jgi:hypothetical protein
MKTVNCLIFVSVFAASYILIDLASGQTSFNRSDVTGSLISLPSRRFPTFCRSLVQR